MSKGNKPQHPSILRPLRPAARQHGGWGIRTLSDQRDRGQSDGRAVYGTYRWQKLVAHIKKKRGNKCERCGATGTRLQADHVVEMKDGGDAWSENNLMLLCPSCHVKKTNEVKRDRSWSSTRDDLLKLIDDDDGPSGEEPTDRGGEG